MEKDQYIGLNSYAASKRSTDYMQVCAFSWDDQAKLADDAARWRFRRFVRRFSAAFCGGAPASAAASTHESVRSREATSRTGSYSSCAKRKYGCVSI